MASGALDQNDTIIVGIGASAGGLEVINEIFDRMPPDLGMAFVIIQHLSPDFESLMDELLAKHTRMPIRVVREQTAVYPNHIYLISKESNIIVEDGFLKPVHRQVRSRINMPIDEFFHSLGHQCKKRAVGIILSGTGTDGSRGIRTIKDNGGVVLVQHPESTRFDGMPRAAIETGLVDQVLLPADLVEVLSHISSRQDEGSSENMPLAEPEQDQFNLILYELLERRGVDFREYRRSTLLRRLEKRLLFSHCRNIKAYLELLRHNPRELDNLFKEFLIGVTRFLRDPEAFELIRNQVLPGLFELGYPGPVRIWVAGCSTGEEAYSLAMVIEDYFQKAGRRREYKIFASDLDSQAVETAARGVFPVSSVEQVPEPWRELFFKPHGNDFLIDKKLRENIVFTVHDVLNDPPFINLDLISCRNLLIYLKPEIQQRLLLNFQFALRSSGFLWLGPSETLRGIEAGFDVIDDRWNIFRYKSQQKVNPPAPGVRRPAGEEAATEQTDEQIYQQERIHTLEKELKQIRLERQDLFERLENANEELQASNQELLAANEQLQNTNEELQSVNEELYTVNSELQKRVNELSVTNADLDNLLEATKIGTIFVDENLCIRKLTPAITRQFNLLNTDIGRPITAFVNTFRGVNIYEDIDQVLRENQVIEKEIVDKSGQAYLMRLLPYRDSQRETRGVVLTFVDINDISKANRLADILAPLTQMKGYLNLLKEIESREDQEFVRQDMLSAVDRMRSTLDGLIELVDFKKHDVSVIRDVSLWKIYKEVFSELEPQLQKAGGTIKTSIPEDLVIPYIEPYMASVLYNLLQNAIKYNAPSRSLQIFAGAELLDNGQVMLTVRDNGIGMDLNRYGHFLFQPFKRLTVERSGTGIGLSIINNAVRRNGGHIEVESQLDRGTTFRVFLQPYLTQVERA